MDEYQVPPGKAGITTYLVLMAVWFLIFQI